MDQNRRRFIRALALSGTAVYLPITSSWSFSDKKPVIACQHYTWFSFLKREGVSWEEDLDKSFALFLKSGLAVYEPSFKDADQVAPLQKAAGRKGIGVKSMYVNSTLHEEKEVEKSISNILLIAREAMDLGVEIVVTNPSPIQWGNPVDKDDKQLAIQARALDTLGSDLGKLGMKLAYHNHDMEMRQSAREFHHMMLNTDPENVHLCLDAHWIYRGAGNSQAALFDIVKLYANRIVEVHIRQSNNGIWSEVFGRGDIDYPRLASELLNHHLKPHLVLEQGAEKGTPETMGAVEAIMKSLQNATDVFKEFA